MGLIQMDLSSVTITIPLHKSLKFSEIISANIERLSAHCKIIVSDCKEEDSLLKDLESKYQGFKNVRVIGKRNLGEGWVCHWNDLMNEVATEYFMWLSHDDEIDLNWVSENLQNLLDNPQLAGSFGLLHQYLDNGELTEHGTRFPSISKSHRKHLANDLIENWNLGIATRAVWTKSKVLPILCTQDPMDEWGDVVWIYGTLLQHEIAQITNVSYRKRWYAGSAHSYWRPLDINLCRKFLLREIERRGLSPRIGQELYEVCEDRLIQQRDEAISQRDGLLSQWDELMNSRFWRITRPIRTFMKMAKWAQTGSSRRPTD
jgi:hypothetical protein